jgi:hypothetical protein
VPARLADAVFRGPLLEASRQAVLVSVPNVGRFLVLRDGFVSVEQAPGAADADLRCFHRGPVAAAAAVLRGELVVRAATVAIDARAVALCGASATGKSALAAALAQRGHGVLADAVTVISHADAGPLTVDPLAPDPVLWPDSARALGLDEANGRLVRRGLAAQAYSLGREAVAAPLASLVFLKVDSAVPSPALEPMTGGGKIQALMGAGWHLRLIEPLGLLGTRFRAVTNVAAQIPCVRLTRPRHGASPQLLARLVEDLAA